MDLTNKYLDLIRRLGLEKKNLLLAVSGGLDSVVLAHLSQQAGLSFSIAHCNFQLRGEESARDESFVAALAKGMGKHLHVKRFDTKAYADAQKISIQDAARQLRYEWFGQLENEAGAQHTLVAHHADDSIETLLMNFFRGTGLQGLTGIPVSPASNVYSVHIVRPLLEIRREEIIGYARMHGLSWVEDSSNQSSDYTRNFFRNEVIPLIRKVYPQAEDNLLDNTIRFQKLAALYQPYVKSLKDKIVEEMPGGQRSVLLKKLLAYQHTSLPFEIFREYGFNEKQVEGIMALAHAQTGKFIENKEWQVIRHRNVLVVAPRVSATGMIAIADVGETSFPGGTLKMEWSHAPCITTDPFSAELDASVIEWPLVLRRWKQGDYFYPLGLGKKKKLARFFIDQKLSKPEKENAWVLESGQKILWVLGMRIDDRAKVRPHTKKVLRLQYLHS